MCVASLSVCTASVLRALNVCASNYVYALVSGECVCARARVCVFVYEANSRTYTRMHVCIMSNVHQKNIHDRKSRERAAFPKRSILAAFLVSSAET